MDHYANHYAEQVKLQVKLRELNESSARTSAGYHLHQAGGPSAVAVVISTTATRHANQRRTHAMACATIKMSFGQRGSNSAAGRLLGTYT